MQAATTTKMQPLPQILDPKSQNSANSTFPARTQDIIYQKMEYNGDGEGNDRPEPAAQQVGADGDDDDGVVGDGDNGGDKDNHQVAETGAELENVDRHGLPYSTS